VAAIVLGAAFVFFVALSSYVFIDQLRTVRDQRRKLGGELPAAAAATSAAAGR
jgi:hypothetical protein